MIPPIPGFSGVPHLTNNNFFNLTALPPRLVVIGGGPIGMELAQVSGSCQCSCFIQLLLNFSYKVSFIIKINSRYQHFMCGKRKVPQRQLFKYTCSSNSVVFEEQYIHIGLCKLRILSISERLILCQGTQWNTISTICTCTLGGNEKFGIFILSDALYSIHEEIDKN